MIKLIVGLGNPESKYKLNRHNIGFNFIDYLAHQSNSSWKLEKKFFATVVIITLESNKIILAKPITYMNESGRAVSALAKFYSLKSTEILVVHDELDLSLGMIKLKFAGGHGGHNGLRDITHNISKEYYRLRIGIGRPEIGEDISNFVLSNPSVKEYEMLTSSMMFVLEHINSIVCNADTAMKLINTQPTE